MLRSEECRDKIDEITQLISRYKEGTEEYELEIPHLQRLRTAYTIELTKAIVREVKD